MRARFTHDGSLDPHADNEHELFRRADEALERQRREAHAATAAAQSGYNGMAAPPTNGIASPVSTGQTTSAAVAAPKMPHEELAERFALKPTTLTTPTRGRRIR